MNPDRLRRFVESETILGFIPSSFMSSVNPMERSVVRKKERIMRILPRLARALNRLSKRAISPSISSSSLLRDLLSHWRALRGISQRTLSSSTSISFSIAFFLAYHLVSYCLVITKR